mgnify:FL=1|jgi:hypothetical protein
MASILTAATSQLPTSASSSSSISFRHVWDMLTTTEQARDLSVQEREQKNDNSIEMVYGELSPTAVLHLFQRMMLMLPTDSRSGSFLDVGSGTGKMLVSAALFGQCETTDTNACAFTNIVGIELLQSLHEAALKNVEVFQTETSTTNQSLQNVSIIQCIHGDALSKETLPTDAWVDFTMVFCNATMFNEGMMKKLSCLPFSPGTICCVTTNKLDDARWEIVETFNLSDGNWGNKTTVFLFKRRTKRETMMRRMAKKMASVK